MTGETEEKKEEVISPEQQEPNAVAKAVGDAWGAARSKIYDLAIVHVTSTWYEAMLEELDEDAVVLDVGIGTATALVQHQHLIMRKNIRIVGIDWDEGYIEAARANIQDASIENCIRVYHQDVYEMDNLRGQIVLPHGSSGGFQSQTEAVQFDAILLSGTFAVLRDRVAALKNLVENWAKPDAKVMIAQAYQRTTPPMARLFKWSLYYFTTVDHGELITEPEAKVLLEETLPEDANLKMVSHEVIDDSIDNALEAAYLTILERK